MYSRQVEPLLKSAGIKIGDRLRYERGGWSIEGLLMPRPDVGDPDCLVLKLASGYNIGLSIGGAKVEKLKGEAHEFLGGPPGGSRKETPSSPAAIQKAASSSADSSSSLRRPPVFLLSTGGTITSSVDYVTGAVFPRMGADELLAAYPRLRSMGPFQSASLMRILSEDMHPLRWTTLARGVADALRDGAEGVVITHGTDTMGYSAAALSFALQGLPAPVLLTGSQRSPDRGSSDAGDNLFCAAAAARAPFAGVGVCMPSEPAGGACQLHWGTRARKCHTSARWAFRSVGLPPFGSVDVRSGEVHLCGSDQTGSAPLSAPASNASPAANDGSSLANGDSFSIFPPPRDPSRVLRLSEKFSSNVHLAWVYPGLTPKTVASWAGFDGVVLAATGLGHAPVAADDPRSPHSVLPAVRELVQSGVVVAVAPQALEGRISMEVYAAGRMLREAGVIGQGADWLPETAYAKLAWVLGQERDPRRVERLMMAPVAGELSPRSLLPANLAEPPL